MPDRSRRSTPAPTPTYCGDRDRRRRQAVPWSQSRQIRFGRRPGVDILVPAPENTYQITTGTSVAAAEVSGIVALLLERNPKLTPADVRRILQSSARRLGPGERDDSFGSGLIDPLKALQLADPRTAATTPATPTTRQR